MKHDAMNKQMKRRNQDIVKESSDFVKLIFTKHL